MRRGRLGAALGCAAALFSIPILAAGDDARPADPAKALAEQEVEIERLQRFEALEDLERVVIDNPFGTIRARFGGYGESVEIRSVLQHFEAEGPRLEVAPSREDGALNVRVGYRQDGQLVTERDESWRKRVDLVVFVPHGIALRTHARDDLTELKGLHGDVEARSRAGEIVARKIDGDLDLASESGRVLAVPKNRTTDKAQRFRSGGDVTIYLFDEANVSFEGESKGLVSTDFSATMTVEDGVKRVGVTLGKGSSSIRAEAGEHLRLVRKPSADRALPRRGNLAAEDDPETAAAEAIADEPAAEATKTETGAGHDPLEVVAVDDGEEHKITTVTGDITLRVGEGSFTLEVATSGEITTDFPIEIEYRYHEEPSKEGLITIGSGATTIRLESRRGAIRVLRAVSPTPSSS